MKGKKIEKEAYIRMASLRVARKFLEVAIVKTVVARFLEAKGTGRGWEHRKEQDERAAVNIPLEHQLLWRKLKTMFKGTPHEKFEQFMEYLEEHPGESEAWLQQNADKELAKVTREWEKKQREQGKLEKECDKNQTKYEEAWYKEQERASKEREKLKQLKQKADGVCEACPTCDKDGNDGHEHGDAYEELGGDVDRPETYDQVPFA